MSSRVARVVRDRPPSGCLPRATGPPVTLAGRTSRHGAHSRATPFLSNAEGGRSPGRRGPPLLPQLRPARIRTEHAELGDGPGHPRCALRRHQQRRRRVRRSCRGVSSRSAPTCWAGSLALADDGTDLRRRGRRLRLPRAERARAMRFVSLLDKVPADAGRYRGHLAHVRHAGRRVLRANRGIFRWSSGTMTVIRARLAVQPRVMGQRADCTSRCPRADSTCSTATAAAASGTQSLGREVSPCVLPFDERRLLVGHRAGRLVSPRRRALHAVPDRRSMPSLRARALSRPGPARRDVCDRDARRRVGRSSIATAGSVSTRHVVGPAHDAVDVHHARPRGRRLDGAPGRACPHRLPVAGLLLHASGRTRPGGPPVPARGPPLSRQGQRRDVPADRPRRQRGTVSRPCRACPPVLVVRADAGSGRRPLRR